MKPYESYKPSGVPWLGDVPGHWISAKLKFRLERNDGGAWGADPEGANDTLVLRSTEQTVDGRWKLEDPAYRKLSPTEAEATLLVEGDLLVTKSSGSETHIGKTSLVDAEIAGLRAGYSNFMQRLRVVDEVIPKYVWYLLNSDTTKTQVNVLASTTTGLANLNAGVLGRLVLAYPPPDEQQAIADFLDAETARIDTLIHEKDGLIGLLREARSSRISELISGDGLPGASTGNPWAPHLPEGWELKRLKHLAQVRSGLAKGKDNGSNPTVELPYLRVANVQEGSLDLREISTMPVEVDAVERFSLKEGDVLMNEGGDYDKVGRGAVWTGEISPCLHQNHVFAVRPEERSLSEWLSAITQTQYAKFYFMNNAKQSTNLASISQANVKELPILLPPKDQREALLKKLGAELVAFDKLIAHTHDEITLLKELRAATIADAVLGRIDVRDSAKTIAACA